MDARLITFVFAMFVPLSASAQDAPTKPTPEQKELNRKAFKAMKAGDSDAAIAAYESSIELGALNVTFLNLGRAQQKLGNCAEAWAAYDEVEAAPAVPKPDRDAVLQSLEKFRAELAASCPTTIRVTCEPENSIVRIGDGHYEDCPVTFEVDPGTHVVEMASEVETAKSVEAVAGRTVDVHIEDLYQPISDPVEPMKPLEPGPVLAPPKAPAQEGDQPSVGLIAAGGSLIVVGVLGGLASAYGDGVFAEYAPAYAKDHKLSAMDFVPTGGYVLSLGAIVTGAILIAKAVR